MVVFRCTIFFANYCILDVEKNEISKDAYQWQWISEHIIENRHLLCWLDHYDYDNDNDNKDNETKNTKIRFEELKNYCQEQSTKLIKSNILKIKDEMELNEQVVQDLILWKYPINSISIENDSNIYKDK